MKISICVLLFIILVFTHYNAICITLLSVAVFVGFCSGFINRLKSLHKYVIIIYLIYFCIVTNLILNVTQIKLVSGTAVVFNVGWNTESVSSYYETFVSLNKQLIITKLKLLISHVQGFSVYSNGLWTVFSFSKNQNTFWLFGVEYICVIIIYMYLMGVFGINYHLKTLIALKYY